VGERDAFAQVVPSLRISPSRHSADHYDLTPGSVIGVVRVGDLTLQIEPKIGSAKVISLASLAFDPRAWKEPSAGLSTSEDMTEALAAALAELTRRALRAGLLQGYRSMDEVLPTVRGRVRFAEQVQQRRGMPLPVAVTYDDYTQDILEHQLIRAAVAKLSQLRLRSPQARRDLSWLRRQLDGVSDVSFTASGAPEPRWTRLNERYRPAVSLARLILRGMSVEARHGGHEVLSFLVDMNAVFEDFVRVGLRERLRLDDRTFPDGDHVPRAYLDRERRWVRLKPDLSWWDRQRAGCHFVGDCKYKRPDTSIPNADVYQLYAYLTALQLPAGLLIYADAENAPREFTVAHGGPRIETRVVDLTRDLQGIASQMDALSSTVMSMNVRAGRPGVDRSA